MVDDFFCFFEVSDLAHELVDFTVGFIFLKILCEFLQLSDLVQQIVDVCVELLDHAAHWLLELRSFLFDSLLLCGYLDR